MGVSDAIRTAIKVRVEERFTKGFSEAEWLAFIQQAACILEEMVAGVLRRQPSSAMLKAIMTACHGPNAEEAARQLAEAIAVGQVAFDEETATLLARHSPDALADIAHIRRGQRLASLPGVYSPHLDPSATLRFGTRPPESIDAHTPLHLRG